MHELSIASAILDRVQQEIDRHPGSRVTRVAVRVGELAGIDPDALSFGFDALVQGTPLAPIVLEIEFCKRRQGCPACGRQFDAPESHTQCPGCGCAETVCITGQELDIAYLEVEDP